MRNLRNTRRLIRQFRDLELPLTALTWDPSSNAVICAFGPSKSAAIIELKRIKDEVDCFEDGTVNIASWDAPCPNPQLEYDQILNIQYFSDTATTCLVLAGGDIVVVREQPLPGEESIEIVGSVDAGISAAEWSPDEELLAMVTEAGTVVYMTRDFEATINLTLSSEDLKASNHVSVGWGKSETQFKGKRAKALRDPTVPERVDEGILSDLDDRRVSITWRGDGAYVAINTIEAEKRRLIRIYSREGAIDSVSEPVDGLEGGISWRPAGNLIACVQRLTDRIDVVFFERNGLRHGQFSLRLSPEEQKSWGDNIALHWNSDSTILAVSFRDRVQFWTMGNYHYYLKQEVKTASSEPHTTTTKVHWHPEKPTKVALSEGNTIQNLEFVWTVSSGPNNPPHDMGSVAVIDGQCLKLTPLRIANVPPPISLHEINVAKNIKDVAFSSDGRKIGVLCEDELYIFSYLVKTKPPSPPQLESRRPLRVENKFHRQLVLHEQQGVFIVSDEINQETSSCCLIHPDGNLTEMLGLPLGYVKIIFQSLSHEKVFLLMSSSKVFELNDKIITQKSYGDGSGPITQFPGDISYVAVAFLGNEKLAFGLTAKGTLYVNEKPLIRNCTSFLLTMDNLVVTTSQHLLKFITLSSEDLDVPPDEPETDERCRSIERGARLVTIMPTTYSVVLQMPRGNLETVYPRALVLDGIRRSIDRGDYGAAFMACRNQRVDMNILHDHSPEQFFESIGQFIEQLRDPSHLDLFLSQLRDEDVTETMYRKISSGLIHNNHHAAKASAPTRNVNPKPNTEGKVNRICDAILRELQRHPGTKMQNIITANVCKQPPDLDSGLAVVGKLQSTKDSEQAERAAEHICFLADVNQLYDHALGLYNLELTLLIAQQSQKDPREYLPYLQSLQELSPLRRSFAIDDKLGRRRKALAHLYELRAFEEFDAYTQNHELYADALQLVKYQPELLNNTMRLYANFLNSRDRFMEAGIAYEYLQDYLSATAAYRAAHLWRESLTCAMLVPYEPDALAALANELAENLVELKDHAAAASIHLDFLRDVETAAKLFCKGYQFDEAMRLLALKGCQNLFSGIIDAGLVEASASMTELVADCKSQINAQVPRLRELRQKKEQDPLAFFAGDPSQIDGADVPDNISLAPTDASTAGTFMTRYTSRTGTINTTTSRKTSKNRRREERKRARGKKGSVYEEEYLVNSIGRLAERISDVTADVERLVKALVRRGMRERAEAVDNAFTEIRIMCEECLPEVYEAAEGEGNGEGVGELERESGDRPQGGDGVLWDSIQEGKKKREPPVLRKFDRLSLV